MINPYANRDTTNRNIRLAEIGARYVATVTTSLGAFIWGQDIASRYLPAEWGWITAALCATTGLLAGGIMGFLTDFMFGNLLQRVTTDTLMRTHPNVVAFNGDRYFTRLRRAESFLFAVLLIGLFAFDIYTTLIIRDPIAQTARSTATIDIAAATEQVTAAQTAAANPMAAQIKDLDTRIRAEEQRVTKANPGLTKLIREDRNTWATQTLERKKTAATKTLRAERDKLTAAYNTTLAGQSATLATAQTQINDENARIAAANQSTRAAMSGMYIGLTVIPKILAIILRIIMVVTFLAYSVSFHPDLTGDGIIDYADVEAWYNQKKQQAAQRRQRAPGDFDDIGTDRAADFT